MFPSGTNVDLLNQINKAMGFGAGVPALPGAQASGGAKAWPAAPAPAANNTPSNTGGGGTSNNSGAISSSLAPLMAQLSAQQADLDRQKGANEGIVNNEYGANRRGLDLGYQQGTDNLNRSEAKVDYTKATSLRDLGNNISSAMRSRLAQIGSLGGGSSSAGLQLSMALHGVDSQQRGDLIDQAQLQYGDINQERKHADQSYHSAVDQLDTWKNNQIARIANDYLTQKGVIDRQMAGADQAKLQALQANSVALAQQAASQLAQVQNVSLAGVDTSGAKQIGAQGATLGAINYNVNPLTGSDPAINYNSGQSPSAGYSVSPLYKKNDN